LLVHALREFLFGGMMACDVEAAHTMIVRFRVEIICKMRRSFFVSKRSVFSGICGDQWAGQAMGFA
jgi:hypothetical protein